MRYFLLLCLFFAVCEAKPTIGIYTFAVNGQKAWDPSSVKTGITGSEEAVIYMSEELAKLGYQVVVIGSPPENSPYSAPEANPRYVPFDYKPEQKFDIAISWRMPDAAKRLREVAKKVYLWPHDTYHWVLSEEQINGFDDVFWLSEWQREQWIQVNGAFNQFTKVIANGINLDQFEPLRERENPYSCIYGSNYGRGLEVLLDIWPKVRKAYPKATLDIYYGWNHWGLLTADKEIKMRAQLALLKNYGVTDHGQVGHEELNRAYSKASYWTYPCTAPEVNPITALRAQYAGAFPVIVKGTGLTEIVKSGYLCESSTDYLAAILTALSQAETFEFENRVKLREHIGKEFTWAKVAEKWKAVFEPAVEEAQEKETKTVFLTILARNKEHVLPKYLDCIEKLDYDKKLITVYINTNNNCDRTEEILKEWAAAHKQEYAAIIFESHQIEELTGTNPHEWPKERFKIIASLRNKSLQKGKESGCDYYFVADCDNFLTPCTLKTLVSKDKPIIAPLLRSVPASYDVYANYFYDVNERGYYEEHPDYYKILHRTKRGTFQAPVVHCTYLIKKEYLDQLNYMDGSDDWEFIIFSRIARQKQIDQYICNEKVFGTQLHFNRSITLEEEKAAIQHIL